jgi:hypothetical protein
MAQGNCANRLSAFDLRPKVEIYALDALREFLPYMRLLGITTPLFGPPPIDREACDSARCEPLWALQKDGFVPSPNA